MNKKYYAEGERDEKSLKIAYPLIRQQLNASRVTN